MDDRRGTAAGADAVPVGLAEEHMSATVREVIADALVLDRHGAGGTGRVLGQEVLQHNAGEVEAVAVPPYRRDRNLDRMWVAYVVVDRDMPHWDLDDHSRWEDHIEELVEVVHKRQLAVGPAHIRLVARTVAGVDRVPAWGQDAIQEGILWPLTATEVLAADFAL